MHKLNCPSCSAEISFQTSVSLYCVCSYCKSEIFLNETKVEVLGKQTDFPSDATPVRLFSEGHYYNKKFSIIGRVRQVWHAGYWNEWSAIFLNTQMMNQLWLVEFQGQWVVLSEIFDLKIPNESDLKIFSQIEYLNQSYFVTDIKESQSAFCEGELPFVFKNNQIKKTVDLKSIGQKKYLSIEFVDGKAKAFLGEFVRWTDLKMSHLNQFEGWP
jgi:hypothetical protein